jgi:hypothetical protein
MVDEFRFSVGDSIACFGRRGYCEKRKMWFATITAQRDPLIEFTQYAESSIEAVIKCVADWLQYDCVLTARPSKDIQPTTE